MPKLDVIRRTAEKARSMSPVISKKYKSLDHRTAKWLVNSLLTTSCRQGQ